MNSSPVTARHRATRSLVALAAAAVLGLTACSATPSGQAAPTAAAGASHNVEHARGTAEVPSEPKRVVVLEPVQLDTSVALGINPVGAAVASNVSGAPAYLGAAAAGIVAVGTVPEPSLEKIAALRPDLIIGTESRHSKLFDQLADIAPTVFMKSQADPWQENVALVGMALNKPDEAQALLQDYEDRCEQISQEFKVDGVSAQLVRPRDETVLSIYGPTSFAGSTLECVGFKIPERDWENSISVDISPERILEAKAEHVFVTTDDVADAATIPAPINENADSFKKLHLVDTSYWISGVGPLGGQAVLDDIEKILREAK